MATLTITLFGSLQLTGAGAPQQTLPTARLQSLLAYLVVESAQPQPRERLAALFWPDEAATAARQNLRQALYQLRQLLETLTPPDAPPFLLITHTTVQFNPAADWQSDVRSFHQLLSEGNDAAAVALYADELLAGLQTNSERFDEWLVISRERLHMQAMAALTRLTTVALHNGQWAQATDYAQRQLFWEPWLEPAHRQLMMALARAGDRHGALAQYEQCCRQLQHELGVSPHADTEALAAQIRAGQLDASPAAAAHVPSSDDPPVSAPLAAPPGRPSVLDWGGASDSPALYGRSQELAELREWIMVVHCRLVTVIGMGGMGKTTVAAALARQNANAFDGVIWRSLLNAPPLGELLQSWLRLLYGPGAIPESLDGQLTLLFTALRERRCLLILDNVESIMQSGERAGYYRAGYEGYGQLFKRFGESHHQSCLLLTSREQPHEVARLLRETPLVRTLALAGLASEAGRAILRTQGMAPSTAAVDELIGRYSGNLLALMLIAETIADLFGGDVTAFLAEAAPIFDDIRDVLDQQYARLAPLERDLLLTLAIERLPLNEATLEQAASHLATKRQFLEALRSLQRRALLETYPTAAGTAFGLQNVVIEYLTDRLVTELCQEVLEASPQLLHHHALLNVHTQEYIRQSQVRMLLAPLGERLLGALGRNGLAQRCQQLLAAIRRAQPLQPGYLAGNLLNLLLHLGMDLRGYDFSHLCVWQADLQGAHLHDVNFDHADLAQSRFTDTFAAIYALAYSADGTLLVAGTANGGIRLWQMPQGEPWAAIQDPAETVYSVAFSPDGALLASAGGDEHVRLWHVATQQLLATLDGPTNLIWSVAISPDGVWLAAGDFDGNVIVWRLATRQVVYRWPAHTAWVRKVLFSPDSRQVISASRDGYVTLWDLANGAQRQRWRAHEGWVLSAAVSPDGTRLVTGSSDQTARLWELPSGRLLNTLVGHTEWVSAVAFQPQGHMIVTASRDLQLRLWNGVSGELQQILTGHTDFLHAVTFASDGATIASGGDDQTVRLWQAQTGNALQTLQGYTFWMRAIAFGPPHVQSEGAPQETVATFTFAGINRTIYCYPLRSDKSSTVLPVDTMGSHHELHGHKLLIIALASSDDGRYLASTGADQTVRIWRAPSWQRCVDEEWVSNPAGDDLLQTLRGHTRVISAVAFSPDGALIASGGEDRTVRLWEWQTAQTRFVLHGHTGGVNRVVFHPNGQLLASGSGDRTIRLWDVQSGACVALYSIDGDNSSMGLVRSVDFSPDGALLASAGDDCLVRLWDVASGVQRQTLRGHEKYITAVAFSPDGALLASAGADQTVQIWETATGQRRACLHGHHSVIYGLAFSPDGELLATNSIDETVRFWQVRTGECIQILRMPGPYLGMKIQGATGISATQKAALKALGASG